MIIGSLHISTENYIYKITNFIKCHDHPLFSPMLQCFPLKSTYKLPSDQLYCSEFITSLPEFIQMKSFTIHHATKLLYSIYYQIHFLFENNIAISFIDLQDIMVIDGVYFYFCNCNKLYNIKKNNCFVITDCYDTSNPFLPPEFQKNTIMPFSTLSTSVYYSLAVIIIYCLHTGNEKRTNNPVNYFLSKSEYLSFLQKYRHTKLYHTLLLCLMEDPIERKLILF